MFRRGVICRKPRIVNTRHNHTHRTILQRQAQTTVYLQRNRPLALVDEMAGASLRTTAAMTTAPQFIINAEFGSLSFHHTLYSLGAGQPYRPIVLRRRLAPIGRLELSGVTRAAQHEAQRLGVAKDGGWVRLPSTSKEGAAIPKVPFEVSQRRALDALFITTAMPPVIRESLKTAQGGALDTSGGGEDDEVVAPAEVAERRAKRDATTAAAVEGLGGVKWLQNGPDEDCIIAPLHNTVATIVVPPEAVDYVRENNKRRAALMALEGRRRSVEGFGVSGLDVGLTCRVHHIALMPRDALFIPQGWKFVFHVSPSASIVRHDDDDDGWGPAVIDALPESTRQLDRGGRSGLTDQQQAALVFGSGDPALVALRHVYKAYPHLSAQQRYEYMPSEFVTSFGDFYERGGNAIFKKHK